jgi:hypothetical protein
MSKIERCTERATKRKAFVAWVCEDALGTYEPYLAVTRQRAISAKGSVKGLRDAKWVVRKVRVSYLP